MDADGLPAADQFSYQWIRNDGTDDSDISGATDSTYLLKAADLGKTIKVKVTFTDEGGAEETLTSGATTAVAADTTGPILTEAYIEGPSGNRAILVFDEILDATNQAAVGDFEVTADGAPIAIGGATVTNLSRDRVFLTSLSPVVYQGQTVTVTYTDPTSSNDANALQDEAGNDAASFATGEDDVPAVTNDSTVEPSTVALVSNKNRMIESAISRTIQAQSFVTGPSTGGYTLSTIQIRLGDDSALPGVTDLIAAIKADDGSGEPGALVANLANPASLTNDALNTFTAPTGTVLAPDTTYWVVVNEERSNSDDWVELAYTGEHGEDVALPVWGIGDGRLWKDSESTNWSESGQPNLIVVSGSVIVGTPDTTGPALESANVKSTGDGILLIFDEFLDTPSASKPPTSAFAVTADGAPVAVESVIVSNLTEGQVTLRQLTPVIYQGQSVIVTYTDPTAGNDEAAIQDEAGVPAVTNDSTVAAPPLVSNIGQTAATGAANVSTTQSSAQGFTTGANTGGYTLGAVELAVTPFDGTASDITVSIYSESSGDPGTLVHTLTTPGSLSDPVTTFTAPSGATLAASTTYYVVASTTSTLFLLSRTEATAEDTGGASGWSIADDRRFSRNLVTWTTATVPIRMRINGAAGAAASTDATLSDLVLNDGTNDLTLTPNFATGTTSYMASVDNAVSQITVTPETNASDASVEYLDGNDAAITDADSVTTGQQVALEVGANTIKVKVTAEDDATTETYTVVVTRTTGPPSTTPSAPTNVQASGNAELTVTWNAPDDGGSAITGYTVQWKSGSESYSTTRQATVTTTTHTIPTLTNGTTYTLRVKATNANGDSDWTEITATPLSGPGVASVTVDQASITQTLADVTVTVANPQNALQVVFVRYRVAGAAWPLLANLVLSDSGTAITFTLTGLTGNTDYEVEASLDDTFTSGVQDTSFTTSPTKPGKTRSVATTSGNGQFVITWSVPSNNGGSAITGYKLQWKSGSQSFGDPSREHIVAASFRGYHITGLTNGTEYTARVIAVNAVGDGPPSDEKTATPVGPPDAPPNVQAGSGHQQLTVSWGAPNDRGSAITEYRLQWKSPGQSFNSSRQRTIAAPSRTDTIPSLINGTEYTVRVRATNASGNGPWSAEAKGTPREGPHVSTVRVKEPISCTVTFVALEFVNLEAATEYQAHLRFRAQGSSSWTVLSPRGFWSSGIPSGAARGELSGPSPAFTLTDLAYETIYEVQAALDSGFVDGLAATTFSTPNLSEAGLMPLSPGDGTLVLRMTRPTSEGRVDGYLLQWKSGDEEYDDTDTSERQADVPGSGDREYTITGLDNGVEYTVRAMAYNDNGVGVPSSEVRGTPEAPPNSPARGAPTISGTVRVGETLTADTSGIDDADGMSGAVFSYQWLADDADIAGATSDTYTPVADDVGKAIKVKMSFRDDRNHQESLTSAATAAVEPRPNSPATGAPTISGTVRVGETLTAETRDIEDADGMSGADVAGATNETYTPVADDVGKAIKVKVSFRDDRNHQESLTSAATAAVEPRPNSPATGAPTISGTAQVGKTLTSDTSGIDDADGMSGAVFSYQWLANGADVAGATNETYTPVADDVGKAIKVKVSFRDDRNHQESLTSAATAAVTAAADDSSIWSATLTVGSIGGFRGFWKDIGMGELTSEVFTLDGVDYTVKVLADSDGPQFYLTLDKALPVGFTLQVGATTLSSQDASIREFSSGATQYGWATNQEAVLADVDTVEVSLTLDE